MAEEKKEEVKAETAQAPAPAAEAKPAGDTKPAAEAKPQGVAAEKIKKEKPSNCAGCNKSVKKKRWYYRSGKFYCTKRCWKTTLKKETKAPEAAIQEQK